MCKLSIGKLSMSKLSVTKLSMSKLSMSKLSVSKLCACKLSISKLSKLSATHSLPPTNCIPCASPTLSVPRYTANMSIALS